MMVALILQDSLKGELISESMMRIAIAGSGGLARILASAINETVHPFIILSRTTQPALEALGYQVAMVDYNSQSDLRYHLRGVNLVISTVSGTSQINLIDAAANADVQRFVPAEFEGPPTRRPERSDPMDRGRAGAIDRLRHWSRSSQTRMTFTVFTCGIFYERLARGGLGSIGIGASSNVYHPGSYLMAIANGTAEVVEYHLSGQPVHVTMTSVYDVARFVIAALDLGIDTWPAEFRMCGDRQTVTTMIIWAENVRAGEPFNIETIQAQDLAAHLEYATYQQDWAKVARMHELIGTEQRRYDFTQPNLNPRVPHVVPVTFWEWLMSHWGATV